MPRFGSTIYASMPGRFIFRLTPDGLDTTRFRDGVYVVSVLAGDIRSNIAVASRRISILN